MPILLDAILCARAARRLHVGALRQRLLPCCTLVAHPRLYPHNSAREKLVQSLGKQKERSNVGNTVGKRKVKQNI